jgi:DNA-binding response OmpR family regulator
MTGKRAGKLLLVEDEHLLRSLIAQFLRTEGFEIVEAADGSQGIDLFATAGPFDVVLLDLNLPFVCGVEVCRKIKSEQPSQPVIICSAAILESHLVALREMRVEHFLSKPYHPLHLLNRIATLISPCDRAEAIAQSPPVRAPIWRTDQHHSGFTPAHTLVKSPILD